MEEFDNTLIVTNENNENEKIYVLDIFSIDQFPGKEYIFYTKNEEEGDYIKTYVSILNEQEDSATLNSIDDENEFKVVQEYINNQEGD